MNTREDRTFELETKVNMLQEAVLIISEVLLNSNLDESEERKVFKLIEEVGNV